MDALSFRWVCHSVYVGNGRWAGGPHPHSKPLQYQWWWGEGEGPGLPSAALVPDDVMLAQGGRTGCSASALVAVQGSAASTASTLGEC